ncbi:glutamyl-tRNA reductase [Arenicella chitinivorans]|uniref:Glutamyl-tRNA reductase n=1 Tax=Arenicella chitinivorans TaxID=1329800 RepID=A0A918RS15_9GAMM|nr:glutamyl-tRNA reductase [Arenicella chitinivorans]GHA06603.1 glutamyl-tRNA reductase [Arenicella chitinivorans]
MHVLSVGLNHTTAPVEVRERAAFAAEHLDEALADIAKQTDIEEATILSTCNRTEVYCHVSDPKIDAVRHWLCNYHALNPDQVNPFLYTLPDHQAVRHAFRVASGLDSMVIGEPQILGQMKTAFATAHKNGTTGKVLNRLFQHTFSVAKEVRTSTHIGSHAVSVAYAAVALSKQIFSDISKQTVLLIGAGETIELTCRHLYAQGVRNIIIANRTVSRAAGLAAEFGATVISLHELPTRLPDADMVFSSTASTLPILGKGAFESALKKRRNNPMFVVDLAVPRDVEAEVGNLNNVYLYTVDDLNQVVNENLKSRQSAALEAEKIVEQHTLNFMHWFDNLQSIPTLRQLRDRTSQITQGELEAAQRRLQAGDDPSKVLEHFAHALSQKFMHHPTESLRQKHDDRLLEATRELFGLDRRK